jgi:hypothetical protein
MIILIDSHAIYALVDPKALTDCDSESPSRITATDLNVVVLIVLMIALNIFLDIFLDFIIVVFRVFIRFKIGLLLVFVVSSHFIT